MPETAAVRSYYAYGAVMLVSLVAGLVTNNFVWFLVPFALVVMTVGVVDIRFLYGCLLFFLPLSAEVELPGGFGTDFPDEPITVGLMFLTFAYLIGSRDRRMDKIYTNPLALLLLLHYAWILFSIGTSSLLVVSLKYALAKMWYLTTFVLLTVLLVRGLRDFKKFFWLLTWPLLFTVVYTLVHHGMHGFTFASVNTMMKPFFRNHVNYAAMISIWLPFVWLATGWYPKGSFTRNGLYLIALVLTTGLILSYTRSGWLAVVGAVAVALVVRMKAVRYALAVGAVALVVSVVHLRTQNRYMEYIPNFKRTIYHKNLNEHLESTYKLEDISSAERVYRWVAGFRMWEANPLVGYGPGNFYNFYKSYTVNSFRTYVSANPEKSTVHNYFLLTLVEQGIIGLLIFGTFTFAIFIYGEKLYHRVTNQQDKRWVMAILMSLTAVYVNNMLSDLIETDKVGSIYFMDIAMLMVLMYKYPPLQKARRDERHVVVE